MNAYRASITSNKTTIKCTCMKNYAGFQQRFIVAIVHKKITILRVMVTIMTIREGHFVKLPTKVNYLKPSLIAFAYVYRS